MEAIILAAGLSRRMGREKLALELGGRTVLSWTIQAVEEACPDLPLTVVVPKDGPVRERALRSGVRVLENPDAEAGIATSLRVGINGSTSPPTLIFLGDQPALSKAGVAAVRAAYGGDSEVLMVAPWYRGAPGHPVLIGPGLYPAIGEMRGDRGARSLWVSIPEIGRRRVDVDEEPPPDLDTPDDYARWVSIWRERRHV